MHLAAALKKEVVALFGPTDPKKIRAVGADAECHHCPKWQPQEIARRHSRRGLETKIRKPLVFVQIHPQAEVGLEAENLQRDEGSVGDGPRLER